MKTALCTCVAVMAILPSAGWCEDAPRQSMKDGVRFYEAHAYDRAAESFEQAARSAHQEKLDAAVPQYNAANALFKMGQFGAAATNFADAMRSSDLSLQSRAYYNRGNALAIGSESQEKQGSLDTAVSSMDEAIAMYESAMTLSPSDEDAKVNYELALKKKQELEQKQQQQQNEQQDKQDQQQQEDPSQEKKDQEKEQQQKRDQQKNEQQQDQNKDQQASQQQSADQQQKEQPAQPQKSEEMTPEEAKIMLDAMKQEEQARRDQMRVVIGQPSPVDKDW